MDKIGKISELKQFFTGYFMLTRIKYSKQWRGYDQYGCCVVYGRTKKECITNARRSGYVVPADVIRG